MRRSRGFTLIELLIVVAIIAILAAIAIPNFIEAQIRSKVSAEKTNMRSIGTAIESYRLDWPTYPIGYWEYRFATEQGYAKYDGITREQFSNMLHLRTVTTPVSYMTSIPEARLSCKPYKHWHADTYPGQPNGSGPTSDIMNKNYHYMSWGWKKFWVTYSRTQEKKWCLQSAGPDREHTDGGMMMWGPRGGYPNKPNTNYAINYMYDSTNGTRSFGDIVRMGP
jgi:prepilin-type N-terminal cleavage/methylation domain-containing protein